jgi:hypothetical protein
MHSRHLHAVMALVVVGCSASRGPSESPAPPAVIPGVCFGPGLDCSGPVFEPVDPSEAILCQPEEGVHLDLVWRTPLGSVACPAPGCPASDAQIAPGNGDLWSVATLRSPHPRNLLGDVRSGFQLSCFDATGNRVFMSVSDLGTRLSPPLPSTEGLTWDSGGPAWLAPTPNRLGLELRRHDAQGKLKQTLPVAGSAIAGSAAWFHDGSWVVVHAREAEHGRSMDVARFDATGALLWNRATIVADAPETLRVELATDARGQTTVAIVDRDLSEVRLLRLDAHGNVVWARTITEVERFGSALMAVDLEGAALVSYISSTQNESGLQPTFAQRIAPDGGPSWRIRLGDGEISWAGLTSVMDIAADASGRWVLLGPAKSPDAASIVVQSADGSSCRRYSFDAPPGVPHASTFNGVTSIGISDARLRLFLGAEKALHFATASAVGTVLLP